MEKFTADKARELVALVDNEELQAVLDSIRNEASTGGSTLYVERPLNARTLTALKTRGFTVETHGGMAVQRENLYYTIKW